MAPRRPNTLSASRPRPNHPTKPHPDQYPEAEIGISTKAPRPSKSKPKTKTPSRHHDRPARLAEAVKEAVAEAVAEVLVEAEADTEEVEQQIENLLGLAEATIPTGKDPPGPREWANFFANVVCSSRYLDAFPAFSTIRPFFSPPVHPFINPPIHHTNTHSHIYLSI